MRGIYTPVTDLRRRLLMETVQCIIEGKDPSECEKCPEDEVIVTDKCQSCMAHPCSIVCPRNAITRMIRP
ncbi:hypothetical protein [Sediminispirochaeta bajacaliforniensis]|uniref:hypothetical protein n=1 Tax=Sediminispirochaeta bajacaliforniensis TaxID=148 RepID=UPI00035F085C|nr:hypothetical protein [Sediminispirochaeta bajacaliforniensis]